MAGGVLGQDQWLGFVLDTNVLGPLWLPLRTYLPMPWQLTVLGVSLA